MLVYLFVVDDIDGGCYVIYCLFGVGGGDLYVVEVVCFGGGGGRGGSVGG